MKSRTSLCGVAARALSSRRGRWARKATAVAERQYTGGACPNTACLPSKNFILSAKVPSYVHRLREFGLEAARVTVNMPGYTRSQTQDGRRPDRGGFRSVRITGAEANARLRPVRWAAADRGRLTTAEFDCVEVKMCSSARATVLLSTTYRSYERRIH
jgi:hypothetical protein